MNQEEIDALSTNWTIENLNTDLPATTAAKAYQAGFLKHRQLVKNLLSKKLARAIASHIAHGNAADSRICTLLRDLQKELP